MNLRLLRFAVLMFLMTGALGLSSCMLLEDNWQPTITSPEFRGPLQEVFKASEDSGKPVSPLLAIPQEGPLKITIEQAVLLALENNRALQVEMMTPSIQRTFVQQELAAFDPIISADLRGSRERIESANRNESRRSATGGTIGVSRNLPTGTTVGVDASTERTWGTSESKQHASRLGMTVTQSLLQGRPVAVNLANVRQARIDEVFSLYELRGFAEGLVAEVESTYWQLVLTIRGMAIVSESLELAEQQLKDTRHRIRVGQLAETEIAAAEAEVALRREALINARSQVSALQVRLLRLIYPQERPANDRTIVTNTEPLIPPVPLETLEDHIALALKLRPELNQAALLVERGDLEIVKTRNGLLPQMDLFITMGKTGYADSFGRSISKMDNHGYDLFVGLSFELPIGNREDGARHDRALLTRDQLENSLENLRDLVRQDVSLAFIEVNRTRQQVDATAATRKAQEEKVRSETAKFRVGKSTALLVATAQRDLLESQVGEVRAVTNYLNARIAFYRAEGSLLARRGLATGIDSLHTTQPATTQPTTPRALEVINSN